MFTRSSNVKKYVHLVPNSSLNHIRVLLLFLYRLDYGKTKIFQDEYPTRETIGVMVQFCRVKVNYLTILHPLCLNDVQKHSIEKKTATPHRLSVIKVLNFNDLNLSPEV